MNIKFLSYIALFCFICHCSVAADQQPLKLKGGDTKIVEDRLSVIENSMDAMQKYLYNLNVVETGGSKSTTNTKNQTESVNLEEVNQQFKNLRSEIERIQYDIGLLNDKILNLTLDIEHKFNNLSYTAVPQEDAHGLLNNIEAEIEGGGNAEEDYGTVKLPFDKEAELLFKQAYAKMEIGESSLALSSFEKFIKTFNKNSLTSSAYFWVGEIYAKNSLYERAAVNYLKGYKNGVDDGSSRTPDNLYGLASSLLKLGKRNASCMVIMRIKNNYYSSQEMTTSLKRRTESLFSEAGC